MEQQYIFGDKTYTKRQVIEYGRSHYPKFYWIKRGIGLGLLGLSLILFMILGILFGFAHENKIELPITFNLVFYSVLAVFCFIAGIVLIILSCNKPSDEDCFIHGKKCLAKIESLKVYNDLSK